MPADATVTTAADPRRLFYWCHTTLRQPFETGIQRVVRRLGAALARNGYDVVPVGRDEGTGLVEVIGRGPTAFEAALPKAGLRPLLFIPELTADLVARGVDPACMGKAYGMRTLTVVHDTIPLKLRDHYSADAQAMFVAYFRSFALTDAVLATGESVAAELRAFLGDNGLRVPPIAVIPLPAQFGDTERARDGGGPPRVPDGPLRLVAVVSWERRKNLLRLLRAFARARAEVPVELTLVGRNGLDAAYDAEVLALLATTEGVTARGSLPDADLARLVAAGHATVYPSWEEGFGLPIGESLWLGRPCLCHQGLAMAAAAPGGGVLAVDMTDEDAIVAALLAMARDPALLPRLGEEARGRPLASWNDYALTVAALLEAG